MISELIQQIKTVPEYFIALKAALAVLAMSVPVYLGLRYFMYRRNLHISFAATLNYISVFILFGVLAFVEASPLATLIPESAIAAYLFLTCIAAAFSIVSLIDVFVLQHYLGHQKHIYISPPLRAVVKLTIFIAAILPILRFILHFNPLALVAIPTIATAGLALALQDTLKTFIAGVGLGKIIRLGEWIGFQGKEGQVIDINWARTVLRTIDNNYVFIPNSQLQTNMFMNFSMDSPETRVSVKVGAAYDAAPTHVKKVLQQCLHGVSGLSANPAPVVVLQEFGDSSINYVVHAWAENFGKMASLHDEISTRIWYAFRREGIEIPYPVRHLYVERASKAKAAGRDEVEKTLQHWTLAQAFYAEELHELSQHTVIRTYGPGEAIVEEGDSGHSLFVIVEGSVGVFKDGKSQEPMAVLNERDIFGEMSLLTGEPRSATVRAITPVEVMEIQKMGLQKVIAQRPELSDKLAQLVTERQKSSAAVAATPSSPQAAVAEKPLASRIRIFFGL